MTKHIAIYGTYETWEPVWQRYWIKRKDGVKQRYWKKTKRLKKVLRKDGRFEFLGTGRDLRKAVRLAHRFLPRDYYTISAREFLSNPEDYGAPGKWVDKHIES